MTYFCCGFYMLFLFKFKCSLWRDKCLSFPCTYFLCSQTVTAFTWEIPSYCYCLGSVTKYLCKMKTSLASIPPHLPHQQLKSRYSLQHSSATSFKAIVISLLSVIWATMLIGLANSEASPDPGSDNHSSRSKIFEEKG